MLARFHAPFRQIHMDFHTHGLIQNVARQFDPEEFALTLNLLGVENKAGLSLSHLKVFFAVFARFAVQFSHSEVRPCWIQPSPAA